MTCRWTVQVGQATSRVLGLDRVVAEVEPCAWLVGESAPQEGQREVPPDTSEMFPHLLQFNTDIPAPLLLLPLLPLPPPLSFLPAFLSNSSCAPQHVKISSHAP